MAGIWASLALPGAVFFSVGVGELADKSALAGALLAARYGWRTVWLGAAPAYALQTVLAVAAGRWLAHPPAAGGMRGPAGLAILAVAAWIWFRGRLPAREPVPGAGGWLAVLLSFLAISALEVGDVTQLVTAAWASRFPGQAWSVALAAWAALLTAAVVPARVGAGLGRRLSEQKLRQATAVALAAAGAWLLVGGLAKAA